MFHSDHQCIHKLLRTCSEQSQSLSLPTHQKDLKKEQQYKVEHASKDILFRQHPIFDRMLYMLSQRAKKYFLQDLKLKSIKTESVTLADECISNNRYSDETQLVYMPLYRIKAHLTKKQTSSKNRFQPKPLEEDDFNLEDIVGYVIMPLDFISRLIGWSTGNIDDQDESPQLSWIMKNFAQQFVEKLFQAVHGHLKFQTFVGNASTGLPADTQIYKSGYLRIVGHTKLSIFMLPKLYHAPTLEHSNLTYTKEDELIEDIPLKLRVRTDKIRIPLHKFQDLHVGSLFPLPKHWLSQVIVSINNRDIFLGNYGESGEEKAVQLTQFIMDQKKLFP